MRPLTTIILLLVAAAAVTFVVVIDSRKQTTAEAARRGRRLAEIPAESINKIEITNAAGRVVLTKSASKGWRLSVPLKDRADAAAVAEILKLATSTEVLERLPAGSAARKIDLKELGLDAGRQARVVFYATGREPVKITVGQPAAYEGTVYVQIREGAAATSEVLIARTAARSVLTRAPGEWRDARLVAAAPERIFRIAVNGTEGEVEVERDRLTPEERKARITALWRISKPLSERADEEQIVDRLLPGLIDARALAFADQPADLGVTPPAVRVVLWSEDEPDDGETLEVFPGAEPKTAWVRMEGRPGFARTSGDLLDLRLCTLRHLRNTKLASIDPRRLTTLILRDAVAGETQLFLFKNQWRLFHDGAATEANRTRVLSLVEMLNRAEVLEWVDKPGAPAEYGLEAPLLEMVFGSAPHPDPSRPTTPTPVDSETLRLGQHTVVEDARQKTRFFAQWSGRPSIYRFDGSILGEVYRDWGHYRNPRLLSFPPLSIRQLTLAQDPAPPLELTFDLAGGARWTAKRDGSDVTEFLDQRSLDRLVNRLSELSANDWMSDPAVGLAALKNPALSLKVTVEHFDEKTGAAQPMQASFAFAPTVPGRVTPLYYGRRNDEPTVFVVRRDLVEDLAQSVLKAPTDSQSATEPR